MGVAAVKWLWGTRLPFEMADRESPLGLLKKRYAKGEISKDEYESIKRDIDNE
jgi:putative membrane protein